MSYTIPQIAAITVLVNGRQVKDGWYIMLDRQDSSTRFLVEMTQQEDCPIFHQAICVLEELGESFNLQKETVLSEVFVYLDFQNIFSVSQNERQKELAAKAESLFAPEGITINFGRGQNRYVAFERSASMSRECRLAFVREDVYPKLKERMQCGLIIGECQLSKLYAYNGLMFSTGERIDDLDLSAEHSIVVIDNPTYLIPHVKQITVQDDGTDNAVRKYTRIEKTGDIAVMGFDGEGLISPYFARELRIHGGGHASFQIRLPYIKGVVHTVDFAAMLQELGVAEITDVWGNRHPVESVHLILTKSMFKGFGWMEQNNVSWNEFRRRWEQYDHALYISGRDKTEQQRTVFFNYQFLNTLQMDADTFRPLDLPLGWKRSPQTDPRTWLTKTTETEYYDLVANPAARKQFFASRISDEPRMERDPNNARAKLVRLNDRFLEEPVYEKELHQRAKSLLRRYSLGQLLVAGDNRYLSDDLMRLILHLIETSEGKTKAYRTVERECLTGNAIYAPSPAYAKQDRYLLLRSPHIARNEEVSAVPLKAVGPLRQKYLSHLRYVVMIDSRSLIAERLGGADYDGDFVKTIAEPLLIECVNAKNDLPVLKIPSANPLLADANDWKARMETVKSTFSSRVGQVSNEALRRGLVAYDESGDDDLQEEYAEDTELLAILIGLEIDSAKSGVKPDLRDYTGFRRAQSSLLLQYKEILEKGERRKWYEDTLNKRLKDFFASVDWEEVTSNIERVPYYAYMLEKETSPYRSKPASDAELFPFAADPMWQTRLEPAKLDRMKEIVSAYHSAVRRCRAKRYDTEVFPRKTDVERILYAQGKDDRYIADELYHLFDSSDAEEIRTIRTWLTEMQWHLLPPNDRRRQLYRLNTHAPLYTEEYIELFCDFHDGGCRLLGDVICDLDDYYRKGKYTSKLYHPDEDRDLKYLLENADRFPSPKDCVDRQCLSLLLLERNGVQLNTHEVVQYGVALNERTFLLEVCPQFVLNYLTPLPTAERKKWWRFWES